MIKVQNVVHETKFTSEISCPTQNLLTQSVEHMSDDQEVLRSIPTGGNFLTEFILLFPM